MSLKSMIDNQVEESCAAAQSPCVSPCSSTTSSSSSSSSTSSSSLTTNHQQTGQLQLHQDNQLDGGQQGQKTCGQQVVLCNCPTSLHTYNESYTRVYSQCPVCLSKFDPETRTPIALTCSHTICVQCASLLLPSIKEGEGVLNSSVATVNYPLLYFLDYTPEVEDPVVEVLCRIARLIRSNTVSRSVHRKTILLINSITPDYGKVLKCVKSLAERCVVELTSSCAHVSHYHAQQQLWSAIRARACQFMGPAMQDEALRLVLLALEDGSALSRKVLVMFVVQRLAPQFPQASKTSVGHIVQLLYRASAFDVLKRPGNSSLMTLRPEFRNYEALRREHDTQIMKIGLEAGIRFTPEQWSSLLYGDTSQKPLMQSIIDKLQSPQTFQELLKEYLVSVQRLSNPDSQFLVSLHQHFKVLAMIDVDKGADTPPHIEDALSLLPHVLESLHSVLVGLISFTANRKHQRNNTRGSANNDRVVVGGGATPLPPPPSPYTSSMGPPQMMGKPPYPPGGGGTKKRSTSDLLQATELSERPSAVGGGGVVGVNNNLVNLMQDLCI